MGNCLCRADGHIVGAAPLKDVPSTGRGGKDYYNNLKVEQTEATTAGDYSEHADDDVTEDNATLPLSPDPPLTSPESLSTLVVDDTSEEEEEESADDGSPYSSPSRWQPNSMSSSRLHNMNDHRNTPSPYHHTVEPQRHPYSTPTTTTMRATPQAINTAAAYGTVSDGSFLPTRYPPSIGGSSSLLSLSTPDRRTAAATRPHHGHAMQARLGRAKSMQLALNKTTTNLNPRRRREGHDEDGGGDDGDNSQPADKTTELVDEFESSISSGTVWAEIATTEPVLALALSRQAPTLTLSTPPLYLAVGTEDGAVTVTELVGDTPLTEGLVAAEAGSPGNPQKFYNDRRLGPSVKARLDGRIRSLDFSPDGQFLAVGDDYGMCTILRLHHEEGVDGFPTLASLATHAQIVRVDRVYAVQFSPNGHYLAIGGFDGVVAICSVKDLASNINPTAPLEVSVEISREGLVYCVDWSPDSRYLAIGGSDKCCALVDAGASWRVFREVRRPGPVQSVKFSPIGGGRYLAIASIDVAIAYRDSGFSINNELQLRPTDSGALYRVNEICWSPNGSYLVACGSDSRCTMLETRQFAPVYEIRRDNVTSTVWGEQSVLGGIPLRYLAIGGEDCVTILKAGLETRGGDSTMDDLSSAASSYCTQGEWVLRDNAFREVEGQNNMLQLDDQFETTSLTATNPGERTFPEGNNILCISFSSGSKSRPSSYVAYGTDTGLVAVKSTTDNWETVATFNFPGAICALAFSNGSRYLVVGSVVDPSVYIVSTSPSWELLGRKRFPACTPAVSFSKNNERLAVGSLDGRLSLFDPKDSFTLTGEIDNVETAVLALTWSSKHLAVGREDGTVSIFASEQVLENLFVPIAEITRTGAVNSVAFGISSRYLAVAASDGTVAMYSAKDGWALCHSVRAEGSVSAVRWAPSGRFLAYCGENQIFKVIDSIFWAEVEGLGINHKCDDPPLSSLSFSQDGRLLALGVGAGFTIMDGSNWSVLYQSSPSHAKAATVAESSIIESSSSLRGRV